jgi:GAF domain-containing protein
MDQQSLRRGVDVLAQILVRDVTLAETQQCVADLVASSIDGATVVGITMLVNDKLASAPLASIFDTSALDVGEGPCLEAFLDQRIRRVDVVDAVDGDRTWEGFRKAASCLGVRSVLAVPLAAGIGSLNLYSLDVAYTADDEATVSAFAGRAGVVLANSQAYWEIRELADHLTEAMQSRATIEQAKGILMAAGGRSPDDAFAVMVRASQRENRKLRDLALAIVERVQQSPTGRGDGRELE